MIGLVADTHAILFYLTDDPKLSAAAAAAIDRALRDSALGISVISLAEVVYLEEKGKIRSGLTAALESLLEKSGSLRLLEVDLATIRAMKTIPRAKVPDFPDRLIAATALVHGVSLVTADARIRASPVATLW